MRKCISCGISNTKVKFNGTQCEPCFDSSPIKEREIVIIEKKIQTWELNRKAQAAKMAELKMPKQKPAKIKKEREYIYKTVEEKFPERKVCSRCEEDKHISEFYMYRDYRPVSICKECRKLYRLEYIEKIGREAYSEYHKNYHKTYKKK